MASQIDSPDGKTHKDPDRPSPAFVETDDRPKESPDSLRPPGAARDETGSAPDSTRTAPSR